MSLTAHITAIDASEKTDFRVSDHRKAIPTPTKFDVTLRQDGKCSKCGRKLQAWSDTQFDHRPALQDRPYDAVTQDFIPPQLDPDFLEACHKKCHDVVTNGIGGERRICTAGSDKGNAAKVRRLTKAQEECRAKMLAKTECPESSKERKTKKKWPSRPFPKAPKAPKTRKGFGR